MIETTEGIDKTTAVDNCFLPLPLLPLEQLSWNYWWSWSADGTSIFRDLDPDVWEECEHNPRQLLARTAEYRLLQMATDPIYIERVGDLSNRFLRYMARPLTTQIGSSQQGRSPISLEHPVVYFCAEFGVHNSLPLYSGGLGMLAGDHLKSASDLRLPLVAVGLLYRFGYFRQRLRRDGWQEEHYGETYPEQLPIHRTLGEDGIPLMIDVSMRERTVHAQVWRADIGHVPLYLLDTNIIENENIDRLVTGHLYGGDRETRIVQEMLLGIGGVRLLRKLKLEPSVFHLNEGHSAFLTLELARELVKSGLSFTEAAQMVRERCVFTTHTPIAAGNDEFDADLVARAFGPAYHQQLGLKHEEFIALGRVDPTDSKEPYGLTPLAIRTCRSTNGVSRKHGEVSRALWLKLWPGRTVDEVPITHVTNGVHAPTWVAPLIRSHYERYVGHDWSEQTRHKGRWEQGIAKIPDEELWAVHSLLKQRLIAFIRHRSFHARLERGENPQYTKSARKMFEPAALTIGFARRIAGYKRWSLLLKDPERLLRIINSPERPVQFVFAGKAHPQDQGAKLILQQVAQWKYDPRVRARAVFLQDYDQEIARQLVQSVDVWLNVPRRPLEASGTSGEKVAMNGGLNLSILDGWWLEGFDGTNGFAIGSSAQSAEAGDVDASDAESLYRVLEQEVVPLYYERGSDGLPRKWISRMKRSMVTLVPEFNSDRMVEEYARRIYS
ncbi:MAG: alpha-glucan family phosphorylase [Pyrinomonadaceae bacterium]|nr:alpha-glucan family phosphorylase [Pyrinomonadaceae bacterium]